MDAAMSTAAMVHMKARLSTLWAFAVLNYLYCDVMSLMNPRTLNQYMAGRINGMDLTSGFFVGAAVLMEIPMSMVLLSRVLSFGANRWANIIAGAIMTVVQVASLFVGTPSIYYMFFSVIEIACTTFIVWQAWKWANPEKAKV